MEFTVSQTMEHFLSCHEHAFVAFGGVPSKNMVDNLKSAVLQRLASAARNEHGLQQFQEKSARPAGLLAF